MPPPQPAAHSPQPTVRSPQSAILMQAPHRGMISPNSSGIATPAQPVANCVSANY
jgi:hypothetical protein